MNVPKQLKLVALITGASGGIGSALCSKFFGAGYHVIASDKNVPTMACTDYSHVPVDLYSFCVSEQARTEALAQLRVAIGERQLAVIVNNAALQIVKPTAALTANDWLHTLNVNMVAPFLMIQSFLPELEASQGSVINISSIHATLTKPEFVAYATSKAALSGLTRSLSIDLGGRVRVNSICPAAIATPMLIDGFDGKADKMRQLAQMHPIGRIGTPLEVASLALFLASDNATFITGAEFQLDGGISNRLFDPV